MIRPRWLAAGVLTAALTFACGGSPKPVSQMASSEAAIRGASRAAAEAQSAQAETQQLEETP